MLFNACVQFTCTHKLYILGVFVTCEFIVGAMPYHRTFSEQSISMYTNFKWVDDQICCNLILSQLLVENFFQFLINVTDVAWSVSLRNLQTASSYSIQVDKATLIVTAVYKVPATKPHMIDKSRQHVLVSFQENTIVNSDTGLHVQPPSTTDSSDNYFELTLIKMSAGQLGQNDIARGHVDGTYPS